MSSAAVAPRQRTDGHLRMTGVGAGYGHVTVCREVDLEVRPGEVMALLGPNGAGKSTLIKALAGLVRATGSMELGDQDLAVMSPQRRARTGLTTVTDDRALFREMTVEENLQLGAMLGRRPVKDALTHLERFPAIASRRTTKAGLLSGGEQQMLAIAKALASGPQLLVLDEPSQGLAPSIVADVGRVLRTLKEENFSVLIAEQNLDLVTGLADRYAVLAGGRIVDTGSIDGLDRDDVARHFLAGEIS
jgi:ABC-type branched-subunit amino acid transport system ATPase component